MGHLDAFDQYSACFVVFDQYLLFIGTSSLGRERCGAAGRDSGDEERSSLNLSSL